MYFKILDVNNDTLGTIMANNYDQACHVAKHLYPNFAFVTEITHAEYHAKIA